MRTKTKIWLGVGAFVMIETAATGGSARLGPEMFPGLSAGPRLPAAAATAGRMHVTQDADHARDAGAGGEAGTLAGLPPELAFAVRVALLRGHLLVGDELIKQQQWNAALPHFLHPTEEIYGDIQGELFGYNVPPFTGPASSSRRRSRRSRPRAANTNRRSSAAGSPSRSNTRTHAASSGRLSA
jgi:hypothetical protein